MYQFSYAEVMEDSADDARSVERQALDRAIALMRLAEGKGPATREAIEAVYFVRRLWSALIEDLAKPENGLPEALRASMISVGLWLMREAERIRQGQAKSFAGMIDICTIVREGLR
jgi:flagellar protein FlaF